jgi:hypothetical protein
MRTTFDIRAEVHLFPTGGGGRKGTTPPRRFGCPAEIEGEFFDCWLLLDEVGSLSPGSTTVVPIKFLRPDFVLPLLKVGSQFKLMEGHRNIATAKVLEI